MAVKRLAGFLNFREMGEKVFNDLADTWWIIGLSLTGSYISLVIVNSHYPIFSRVLSVVLIVDDIYAVHGTCHGLVFCSHGASWSRNPRLLLMF